MHSAQDLLMDFAKRVEKLERMIGKMERMKAVAKEGPCHDNVKEEAADHVVNGRNIMRIHSRDAYSYGLQLMDMMFTKEELASSLLFKSKKVKSLD